MGGPGRSWSCPPSPAPPTRCSPRPMRRRTATPARPSRASRPCLGGMRALPGDSRRRKRGTHCMASSRRRAATAPGITTTLGRGGSDYSAALVGAALDAQEIQIWTDVSGVLTADPRVVPGARTVANLSYAEAAELAYFGAKVLHPKTIQPAVDRDIPVRICNSRSPRDAGTVVTAQGEVCPGGVKAIAHKCGVTILQITSARMLGAYGFLRALFEVFDRHRTAVDVVTTSEVSVSLTVEDTGSLDAIVADLRGLGTVSLERDRAIVCVVGEGLRATPGIAARVLATVRDINVALISQGASRVNLTFVVEEARVREAVCRLHQAFFEPTRSVA